MTTDTHIAGELYGLSAHPGDIYHRAAMTVEMLLRERDEARSRFNDIDLCRMAQSPCNALLDAETRIAELTRERDEARAAALEEAAKVVEEFNLAKHAAHDIATGVFPKKSFIGEAVAAAIRALKEPVASLREAGLAKPNCPNLEGGKHD
jgi:hypothetical protein